MSRVPRGFLASALWIGGGVAIALVPLACSSSPSDAGGDAPHDMTMTNPG